ncbi:MAG TPA: ABC transporter ATP-binding protein, partial [Gaiellaceae bacterium]
MKVWQPGGHLTQQRGAKVEDWSWRQTVRRMATLARLAAPYKRQTALALGFLLAATATALVPPYLAKLAIDDGIRKQDLHALSIVVGFFIFAGALNLVTSAAQTYFTGWTGERILADLRNTLFRHLQRLSLGFYERNRAGVIISRLTNDVEALDQLVTDGVTTLVQSTLFLIGTSVILFFLDWRLALATMTVLPFMFVATAFFRIYSARAYRAVRERLGLVTATLAEDISGMRVVQAFRRERANEKNFR